MPKTIIIEKGKYSTHYSRELEDIIDSLLDNMYTGQQLVITITKPETIIRGNY